MSYMQCWLNYFLLVFWKKIQFNFQAINVVNFRLWVV